MSSLSTEREVLSSLASKIDHTLLRPNATATEIRQLCSEARQYRFATVCVNSYWVPLAAAELAGSPVKVCTVIGFPLGASSTSAKAAETEIATVQGASEIDMVINIGELIAGNDDAVRQDVAAVAAAAHNRGGILKVILETSLLNDEQKILACNLAQSAGADFVKTSTGFSNGGATVHDVSLMRRAVGEKMGVKASGGIRTVQDLKNMLAAGANRIGASAGVQILQSSSSTQGGY